MLLNDLELIEVNGKIKEKLICSDCKNKGDFSDYNARKQVFVCNNCGQLMEVKNG